MACVWVVLVLAGGAGDGTIWKMEGLRERNEQQRDTRFFVFGDKLHRRRETFNLFEICCGEFPLWWVFTTRGEFIRCGG